MSKQTAVEYLFHTFFNEDNTSDYVLRVFEEALEMEQKQSKVHTINEELFLKMKPGTANFSSVFYNGEIYYQYQASFYNLMKFQREFLKSKTNE
jgi:hypothetical protein